MNYALIKFVAHRTSYLVLLLFFCSLSSLSAQGVDELFAQARTKAFAGEREAARELCSQILDKSPNYHDVRILLGRTYAWDKQYEAGRIALQQVLDNKPSYKDAIHALSDLELWAGNQKQSLEVLNNGLAHHPTAIDLLLKKGKLQVKLEERKGAIKTYKKILTLDPEHQEAKDKLKTLQKTDLKNAINISGKYQTHTDVFGNFYLGSISYKRKTGMGSIIARANFANKFQRNAWQAEIDFYPRLGKGIYAWFNYGYSNTSLFPNHRLAGELFLGLPKAKEISLGFRQLHFGNNNRTTIYSASFTQYKGNYMFLLRGNLTPKEVGSSKSASLSIRRYYQAKHFWAISAGAGFSPADFRIQSNVGLIVEKPYFFRAQSASFQYQRPLNKQHILNGGIALIRQETSFQRGNYVWAISVNGGWNFSF